MTKTPYQSNRSTTRSDGKMAFSPQARAIADKRMNAGVLSRVQKKLGTDGTFTDAFKAAFDPDNQYEQILERIHLEKELDAARKVITALRAFPNDQDCQRILKEMRSQPIRRKKDCVHCPIWRHEHETSLTLAARRRYVFPRVSSELYLVTIIFDFAENLDQLEQALAAANKNLTKMAAFMGRKRCGVMMVGTFEFDLLSHEQLTDQPKSKALLAEIGVVATDAGGWALTGHFFTRVPHRDVLEPWLREQYPSSDPNWHRVQFDRVKGNKKLEEHLSRIISYGGKLPEQLFKPPSRKTKGSERKTANELMRRMSSAFYGTTANTYIDQTAFDLNAAIAQWAKFVDRVGARQMHYSVETTHAQKWYSESEVDYIRKTDADLLSDGSHKIEIHRDHGPFPPHNTLLHLKGRMRDLRTRRLTYDAEWEAMTDCTDIDPYTQRPDFNRWMMKP